MKLSDLYPNNILTAQDLQGQGIVPFKIAGAEIDDQKIMLLSFSKCGVPDLASCKLRLSKTVRLGLVDLLESDDTDDWVNRWIALCATKENGADAIRIAEQEPDDRGRVGRHGPKPGTPYLKKSYYEVFDLIMRIARGEEMPFFMEPYPDYRQLVAILVATRYFLRPEYRHGSGQSSRRIYYRLRGDPVERAFLFRLLGSPWEQTDRPEIKVQMAEFCDWLKNMGLILDTHRKPKPSNSNNEELIGNLKDVCRKINEFYQTHQPGSNPDALGWFEKLSISAAEPIPNKAKPLFFIPGLECVEKKQPGLASDCHVNMDKLPEKKRLYVAYSEHEGKFKIGLTGRDDVGKRMKEFRNMWHDIILINAIPGNSTLEIHVQDFCDDDRVVREENDGMPQYESESFWDTPTVRNTIERIFALSKGYLYSEQHPELFKIWNDKPDIRKPKNR